MPLTTTTTNDKQNHCGTFNQNFEQNDSTFTEIPMETITDTDESTAIYDIPKCSLNVIMNYFDPYAKMCGYVPYFSALLAMIIAQAITFIVSYMLKAHDIIGMNKPMATYLNIY